MSSDDRTLKMYRRFLKESGVYGKATKTHYASFLEFIENDSDSDCNSAIDYLKRYISISGREGFLQDSRCFTAWIDTPEGENFWWVLSNIWGCICHIDEIDDTGEHITPTFAQEEIKAITYVMRYYGGQIPAFLSEFAEKVKKVLKDIINDEKNKFNIYE